MVRATLREQAELTLDFENVPDAPGHSSKDGKVTPAAPATKLYRVVAVGFGLLCILQAALNISLRLALYRPDDKTSDTETICKNMLEDADKLRNVTDQHFQEGWMYFHLSFYYISSIKKSWEESRKDCLQRDADLVIINTKQEQDFTRKFYKRMWIGLTARHGNMWRWRWVDGTPLNKSFWATSEPNGVPNRDEACAETKKFLSVNSWNDEFCDLKLYWMCEKTVTP